MSYGDGNLHKRIEQLERANSRLLRRNVLLESLVRDVRDVLKVSPQTSATVALLDMVEGRMAALGLLEGGE